ncbi:hypothetical protein HPB52_010889 [Rhipicephalus sanguineus]|uniref:Reverse transcriptase domain-containing protein n=1 Tax=Rhipicephalus sanguineus TaxID=34632 RepID=A0A9D4PVU2_RHISA|nr:hypothetical protein HPB52_010889 [Rhipicephalus sanguineus]
MAKVILGDLASSTYELNPRDTPHGAVLSTFVFNLVLHSLPGKLDRIPGLKHTVYADDVALWVTSASDGRIEQTLQRATGVVTSHAHAADLTFSAAKSALLVMRPRDRRRYESPQPTITVHANSATVPVVSYLRVLGLIIQCNRHNAHTIDKLSLSVQQTARFENQFNKLKIPESRLITHFDYNSIMLYGSTAFAIDKKNPTMLKKNGEKLEEVYEKYIMSGIDSIRVDILYEGA